MTRKEWKTRVVLTCNVCGEEIGSAESDYAPSTAFQEKLALDKIRVENRVGSFTFAKGEIEDVCRPCLEHLSHWLLGEDPPAITVKSDSEEEVPY